MKKIVKLSCCICLVVSLLSLSACSETSNATKGSDEFATYLVELTPELIGDESYELNLLISDPESLGLEIEEYKVSFVTLEDYEEGVAQASQILLDLEEYIYDELDEDQQITYDVLQRAMQDVVDQEDMYYLTTNYLDVNNGVPQSLPLTLYFYNIDNQVDLDSFVSILESTTTLFKQYVELEETRQELGYGLSSTYMDSVIEQIETFIEGNHDYIIESANTKIEALDFLSADEKDSYKQAVMHAYYDSFLVAYETLLTDLYAIEILTEDEDASLADYEYGQEYYEYKVYTYSGFDDIEEYRSYLQSIQTECIYLFRDLLLEYPELQTVESYEVDYTNIDDVNELLAYFEEVVAASGDYPIVESLSYHMEEVPESLQDIIQASAMYYISPLDELNSEERLVLNGSFTSDDYNTIAHEGYPGHMYQHNYFKNTGANILRSMFGNLGYKEAWANYSGYQMNEYSDDPIMAEFMRINELYSYALILELDIQIHYDNLDRDDATSYLMSYYGLDEESATATYEQLLENPGVFIPYYGYLYRFYDLKETVIETMGDDYSELYFHTLILDLGALPYDMLEERVLDSIE